MISQIAMAEILVDVIWKDIKNVYLRVYPPTGRVRLSAPKTMSPEAIREFLVSRLNWIRKQQTKIRGSRQESLPQYVDQESHELWGTRYPLKLIEREAPPRVELQQGHILLQIRPGTDVEKRGVLFDAWYRSQLRRAVPPLLQHWEAVLSVKVERFFVRRMKTRWGSCNYRRHTIRLNTELARRLPECLEYVVVHELMHLLEPSHNARFHELMDRYMPKWQELRKELDRGALGTFS